MKVGYKTHTDNEFKSVQLPNDDSSPILVSVAQTKDNNMENKFLVWHIEGGLGKNIAATALIPSIVKKYKMVRNGFTEFMVIDEKDRHFNINNSVWYWKWDSVEDWSKIKEGDELYFKYYGWRVPSLGLFPNIYMTNRAQFLDSMTSSQIRVFKYEQPIKINT